MEIQLPKKITDLVETIEGQEKFTPALAGQILEDADLVADDLMTWAEFGHPAANSYGRNLVWHGKGFELMVMSWQPGDMAAIHDHGYTQWGAVRMFGDADHAIFRIEDDYLVTTDRRTFAAGSVIRVANDLIHQMGNTGKDRFLSLHLYGCDDREGDITSEARLYELEDDRIQRVDGGVFYGLTNDEILRTEPGPKTDFTTRLRHRIELLRRLLTRHGSLAARAYHSPREKSLGDRLFGLSHWTGLTPSGSDSQAPSSKPEAIAEDLKAAARLKCELIGAGLGIGGLVQLAERLQEISTMVEPQQTVDANCDLVDNAA